jgi:hypothetical protein
MNIVIVVKFSRHPENAYQWVNLILHIISMVHQFSQIKHQNFQACVSNWQIKLILVSPTYSSRKNFNSLHFIFY